MGMSIEELKKHLFELSLVLDFKSAERDYVALRRAHYDNIQWLHNHGLSEEYYHYLVGYMEETE